MSQTLKKVELVKLGLRPVDADIVLFTNRQPRGRVVPMFKAGSLTFGVEMEVVQAPYQQVIDKATAKGLEIAYRGYTHADSKTQYKLVTDGSLVGSNPIECVSPILKGHTGEASIKKMCKALNEVGATANRSCGLHIHFGLDGITDEHYVNIFKNYQVLEALIDSFMPVSRRGNNGNYCRSLRDYDFTNCRTKRDVMLVICTRYTKVNSQSYDRHNTIEFRHHSGTCDSTKVLNWVNFLRGLISYSKENVLTSCPASINEIPFIDDNLKSFYTERANHLS